MCTDMQHASDEDEEEEEEVKKTQRIRVHHQQRCSTVVDRKINDSKLYLILT